ncbi:hypothetical protein [Wenling crustacean virus 12]|uniref:Uncharacterized protein n=1 Tax=Wenling crustacean virus 12 TaxID=1923481 RepID=A0A1L3KNC6_9MONO|nr:hypothetical protein [Wenling crustacean virus 12]APG78839.1 hypothetical protein [Wenling crustacean virus 12]
MASQHDTLSIHANQESLLQGPDVSSEEASTPPAPRKRINIRKASSQPSPHKRPKLGVTLESLSQQVKIGFNKLENQINSILTLLQTYESRVTELERKLASMGVNAGTTGPTLAKQHAVAPVTAPLLLPSTPVDWDNL